MRSGTTHWFVVVDMLTFYIFSKSENWLKQKRNLYEKKKRLFEPFKERELNSGGVVLI